ncbi:protein-export membrane protein [Vibrio sp. AND4]|nr:protein-export membrane protein [Vibrio sp. AND4]
MLIKSDAGWSSLVARRAHNPKVVGSNPAPATNLILLLKKSDSIGKFAQC